MRLDFFKYEKTYLTSWFNIIKAISSSNELIYIDKDSKCFEYIMPINSQNFYFHFQYENIQEHIEKDIEKFKITKFNSNLFGENKLISYFKEKYNFHHLIASKPILLTSINLGNNNPKFIVIDGNHRVSAKTNCEFLYKTINCIIYNTLQPSDFSFKIDYLMWVFINEINYFLSHEYVLENLLEHSCLNKIK
jgi:hypothetical protein